MVRGSTSLTCTPPRVTIASSSGRKDAACSGSAFRHSTSASFCRRAIWLTGASSGSPASSAITGTKDRGMQPLQQGARVPARGALGHVPLQAAQQRLAVEPGL